MSDVRRFALAFGVGLLAFAATSGPSFAQPQPANPTLAQPEAQKQGAPGAKGAESKAPATPAGTSAIVMDLSAIDGLIGRSVKSSAGEDMGRITDLLVTPAGQIRAAVIDFGGILGVGSRKVAVDWKTLSFANITKNGTVDLALSRNEVRVAPEYKSGDPIVILEAPKAIKSTPSEGKPSQSTPEKPAAAGPPSADDAKGSPSGK